MTMTKRDPYERPPIVGRCAKCGRGFCTMPIDGKDHYGTPECGGEVTTVADETELLREQLRSGSERAREVAKSRGVKRHPRLTAIRAGGETTSSAKEG